MARGAIAHRASGLTDKQRVFILAYVTCGNARQAALEAGYSDRTADRASADLLKLPAIADVLARSRRAFMQTVGVNAERTLAEITHVAFSDITTLFKDNNLLPINEWPEETRRAVAAVDIEERDGVRRTRIKFWDKVKATEQLGRHLELFKDTININVNVGLAERLQAARQRLLSLPAPAEQPILDVVSEPVELEPIRAKPLK